MTKRLDQFLEDKPPPTPLVVLELNVVRACYAELRQALPSAEIFYAVKANPAREVVGALAELGGNFDLASSGELEICRDLGIRTAPALVRQHHQARKRDLGSDDGRFRLFAFDSEAETQKLARHAPSAKVFCRLLIENTGAEWPLSRKFDCDAHVAADLLVAAKALGLRPAGMYSAT
jgi:ornithine decarboxylase